MKKILLIILILMLSFNLFALGNIKIKIFKTENTEYLEGLIDNFIKNKNIIDIKYQMVSFDYRNERVLYSVIIIYQE